MKDTRLTDIQLERGLREIAPASAPAGLQGRIRLEVENVRQERPLPVPLRAFGDPDPLARRRAVLIAAAFAIAAGLVALGVAGNLLDRRDAPLPPLGLTPPEDLPTLVRSAYERMSELPAMTIHATDSDGARYRILVDERGSTRIETYDSAGASEPSSVRLFVGTAMGETLRHEGELVWYQQADAIGEDPRVFVFATLGSSRGAPVAGCEVAISEGEVYANTPSRGWRWIGGDEVAGRLAHHVACAGNELWIDAETFLTLRSQATAIDDAGEPLPGRLRRTEVASVELGPPPAELFTMSAPRGLAIIDDETYACASNPACPAPLSPIAIPPPASGAGPPAPLEALLATSQAAVADIGAFAVTVVSSSQAYPGSTTRVFHDGSGRYRREITWPESPDPPSITLADDDTYVTTELTTDGVVYWRDRSKTERRIRYPLELPEACAGGWTLVGVDLVLGRPADHISCPGPLAPDGYWIDRDTSLVVRVQSLYDEAVGAEIQEVTALELGPQAAELFELPPDADLRP